MNPGLVVKLRPSGPWRIGPDSGARNRVDFIYHSDSLYSAVTSAVARMGRLEEWLQDTAKAAPPAVCFSSCFPFVDDIGYVVPPRDIWPPVSNSPAAEPTRWKSARFVPLGIVQSLLAGQKLSGQQWSVDGASQCLVPAGKPGPFRTDTRWSAAVDRLTGAAERHSTTCLEFRPGAGLWTIVQFRDEAAQAKWSDVVKTAFRWLADSGFGGERSRGWGRSEAPEFVEGTLPDLILPPVAAAAPVAEAAPEAAIETPTEAKPVEPEVEAASVVAAPEVAALSVEPEAQEPQEPAEAEALPVEAALAETANEAIVDEPETAASPVEEEKLPETPEPAAVAEAEPVAEAVPVVEAAAAPETEEIAPRFEPIMEEPPRVADAVDRHWLLSLFSPAAADQLDWSRGSYSLTTRGGRVESPAGSGELKKLVQMVTEGSVVCGIAPTGSAPDVAPDGFAHPVFRAGFAVSIPLPGARS